MRVRRRIKQWLVRSTWAMEIYENILSLMANQGEEPVPPSLDAAIRDSFSEVTDFSQESFELVIPFLSDGYYDPGQLYGLPENCYPPEGSDERTLDGLATIRLLQHGREVVLPKQLSELLFDFYEDRIQEQEIDIEPQGREFDD